MAIYSMKHEGKVMDANSRGTLDPNCQVKEYARLPKHAANRFGLVTTWLTLACGVLLLSGCDLTPEGESGPFRPSDNICNDVTSQSYMQCGYYEPPKSPNDYTWGSAG
jgi:hypothetical protein